MNPALLELKSVEIEATSFGSSKRARIVDQVGLAVHEDELVAVLGPSGSGKSALVRVAAGLTHPSSGQVLYRGEPLAGVAPHIGVVFQTPALFPWMNVHENISLGLEKLGMPEHRRSESAAWAIDRVGLEGYEEAYPRELSSGMKMRVALARALAGQPELLVLDDTFSSLDVLTAESLRAELLALWQNTDVNPRAILLVTHNIPEAVSLANRVVVLGGSPTRIKVEVPVPLPYPRDPNSQEFLDKVSQIHDLITRDVMPDESPQAGRFAARLAPLPRAEIGQIIGFLEALDDQKGRFDVFDFVAETRKEYSSVLMVVNAAEMLELVRTPKDQVEITALGRQFLRSDVNARKMLLNLQLQKLKLITHVMELLQKAPERWVAKEFLLEDFVMLFPSENPNRLFNTLVAWVRYAELMGYSARRGQLYLDRIFSQHEGQIQELRLEKPAPRPKEPKPAPPLPAEPGPPPAEEPK